MSYEYLNYFGDKYYLHKGLTKKGSNKYWFSKKLDGNLVDNIPDKYEIYEEPNGMVYLRRIQLQIITENEIEAVRNSIPKSLNFKVDTKKKIITVYISKSGYSYQALMRFILVDEKIRKFEAQRYCFRGAIDDWIELDDSTDLEMLANKCCIHLGKDSFYDLPYMVDGCLIKKI